MPTPPAPPVMHDVARLAGVSHQTVSRVVNGHRSIRPATRERVEQAIRELGYRPNAAARALVTRRSGSIGVVGTASAHWGPTSVRRAVEASALAAGYAVTSATLDDVGARSLAEAVDRLTAQAVEGIVVVAAQDDVLDAVRSQGAGVPIVVAPGDQVGVDQVAGTRLATQHLLDLGHRRVEHVAGPDDWAEARGRRRGWAGALADAGARAGQVVAGDWSARSGHDAGRRIAADPDATAVLCANDQMAIGVLAALHEHGRRVPDDVSVVGFDDLPEAAYLTPPLTTVRQDLDAVGRLAVDVLRATGRETADDGADDAAGRLVAPALVVRASTAPPKELT